MEHARPHDIGTSHAPKKSSAPAERAVQSLAGASLPASEPRSSEAGEHFTNTADGTERELGESFDREHGVPSALLSGASAPGALLGAGRRLHSSRGAADARFSPVADLIARLDRDIVAAGARLQAIRDAADAEARELAAIERMREAVFELACREVLREDALARVIVEDAEAAAGRQA